MKKSVYMILSTLLFFSQMILNANAQTDYITENKQTKQTISVDTQYKPVTPLDATLMNTIPLGYGSFKQGDQLGGTILTIMDGVSLTTLVIGLGIFATEYLVDQANPSQHTGYEGLLGLGVISLGTAGLGAGRLVGYTVPWIYESTRSAVYYQEKSALLPAKQLINYQVEF